MTFRKPLPHALPTTFSVADAYDRGFTRGQMRNRSLASPFHGTRLDAAVSITLELACRAVATRLPRGAAISHRTAALLHGIPLPLGPDSAVDVTVPSPGRALRRRGIRGHSAALEPGDAMMLSTIPVTTVERTWCDLGALLELADLVAAADYLLWRESPRTTAARLARAVEAYPSRVGRPQLRRALALSSDSSRSRPESILRVDLALSDLPTPIPNHAVFLPLARRWVYLDLAFPEQKLELEYHGDHHRTDSRQWRSDVRRANDIGDEGWHTLQFTGDDLADRPEVRNRIERRLRMLGWGS